MHAVVSELFDDSGKSCSADMILVSSFLLFFLPCFSISVCDLN